eukprot:4206086-Pleurochrysis_carterae.AAC.3
MVCMRRSLCLTCWHEHIESPEKQDSSNALPQHKYGRGVHDTQGRVNEPLLPDPATIDYFLDQRQAKKGYSRLLEIDLYLLIVKNGPFGEQSDAQSTTQEGHSIYKLLFVQKSLRNVTHEGADLRRTSSHRSGRKRQYNQLSQLRRLTWSTRHCVHGAHLSTGATARCAVDKLIDTAKRLACRLWGAVFVEIIDGALDSFLLGRARPYAVLWA